MRKKLAILFAGALVAGLFAAAGPAQANHDDDAQPSDACSGGQVDGLVATDGESSISVCVEDLGATTASQEDNGGYVIVDGDSGNALAANVNHCLDGYIGAEVEGEDVRVVASGGESAGGDSDHYTYPEGEADEDPDPSVCA